MIETEKKKIQSVQSKNYRKKLNVELSCESNKYRKLIRSSPLKDVDIDKEWEKQICKAMVEGKVNNIENLQRI